MDNNSVNLGQRLTLSNRQELCVNNVNKILSSNENTVTFSTSMGDMEVNGSKLNIVELNSSSKNLTICGTIDCVKYSKAKEQKKSLLKRIFK